MKKMTDEEKAKKVDEVLDDFDFQKVYQVMELLDWKWIDKWPTMRQLIKKAEELLYDVLNNDDLISTSSGGFMAGIDNEELYLYFIVEKSSTFLNDDEKKEDEV